jgi:hypothetical protein
MKNADPECCSLFYRPAAINEIKLAEFGETGSYFPPVKGMSMPALNRAQAAKIRSRRVCVGRLGAVFASGLVTLSCAGLAFPAQSPLPAPAADAFAPALVPGTSGQSQSVALGQTLKGISSEAWTHMMAEVSAQTYSAHPDPQHRDTLIADNPAQRLAVRFARSAVSFTTEAPTSAPRRARDGPRSGNPDSVASDDFSTAHAPRRGFNAVRRTHRRRQSD